MTSTGMQLDSLEPVASKERQILSFVCLFLIPTLLVLLTLWALFFLPSRYPAPQSKVLTYYSATGPLEHASPEQIRGILQGPAQQALNLHQKNSLLFQLPALPPKSDTYLVHISGPELSALSCLLSPAWHPLPVRPANLAPGKLPTHGYLLDLGANPGASLIWCQAQVHSASPLRLELWPEADLQLSAIHQIRSVSLLEGSVIGFSLLLLILALLNRNWTYLLLSVWLLTSLRLGSASMGWDWQWLGHILPTDALPLLRRLSISCYFLICYALFSKLLAPSLSSRYIEKCLRPLPYAAALLILASPFAPSGLFLPLVLILAVGALGLLGFLILKALTQSGPRTQLWQLVCLSMILCLLLSAVYLVVFGRSHFIETFNGITSLVLASLMVVLVLAEHVRSQFSPSISVDQQHQYTLAPVGFFSLDTEGRFTAMDGLVQAWLQTRFSSLEPLYWHQFFPTQVWSQVCERQGQGTQIAPLETNNTSNTSIPNQFLLRAVCTEAEHINGSLQDISEASRLMAQLQLAADSDPVTSLLNQQGIEKIVNDLLAGSKQQNGKSMLAYLNLNSVKYINPGMGHASSEALLKAASDHIHPLLSADQHIGRISNDEFLIVFPDCTTEEVHAKAAQIIGALNEQPLSIGNRSVNLKSTIGLIEVGSQMSTQEAISAAHRAAHEARKQMQDVVLYTQNSNELNEHAAELRLFEELEGGSSRGLFLEMQPIMSLKAPLNSLDMEILLRVRDAKGQLMPSGRIVAAAEQSDTIIIIDKWVFSSTLEWLSKHEQHLGHARQININLSGVSLNNDSFIQSFIDILTQYEHLLKRICVEITEGVALEDLERTRHFMTKLQKLGVRIALDDFGAGYTSFQYLRELPADAIKIDGALICDMLKKETNVAIVRTIVKLANNLGMVTIAEWVEDIPTLNALAEIGVDYVQGFIVAKPCSPTDILNASTILDLIKDPQVRNVVRNLQYQQSTAA